jgi:hypothetical protein
MVVLAFGDSLTAKVNMTSHHPEKDALLGMPAGTAFHRLRKSLMFSMAVQLNRHICYRCNQEIASAAEFSIEHKEAWQPAANPPEVFFDLNNIAFSHLSCNVKAASRPPLTFPRPQSTEERRKRNAFYMRKSYQKNKIKLSEKRKAARIAAKKKRIEIKYLISGDFRLDS